MCFAFKFLRYSIRNNLYLIVGILFGVTSSLFILQLFQQQCLVDRNFQLSLKGELEDEDSYEPRINLAGKPLKAQKTPQEFIRPRYYSTELGIREKLFIGILTSPATFDSLGVALNKTIQNVASKVLFFSEAAEGEHKRENSLLGLVIFTDSRLILKPFHALKYIADNLLDDYDYYYLVSDTSYVNGRKLKRTVNSLSISHDVHLGVKPDFESSFCSLGKLVPT